MADNKYHQVAVPDHPGGSSFVRVGSFPSGSDPAPLPASYGKASTMAGVTTASKLSTSGLWSHTDGVRINTTVGNAVDVIQGTYFSSRTAAASPPGPSVTLTWASSSYTQNGSPDLFVGNGASAASLSPYDGAGDGIPTTPYSVTSVVSHAQAFPNDSNDTVSGGASGADPTTGAPETNASSQAATVSSPASEGDAVTATWAERVLTYVGSPGKLVPFAFTQTCARTYTTYNYTEGNLNTINVVRSGGDSYTKVDVNGGGAVKSYTTVSGGGGVYTSVEVDGAAGVETQTLGTSITATNTARGAITTTNTAVNIFTNNLGVQEVLNEGAQVVMNLGPVLTVNLPSWLTFTGDETGVKLASDEIDGIKTRIDGVQSNMAVTANSLQSVKSDLTAVRDDINGAFTKIAGSVNRIHEVQMEIGEGEMDLYEGHVHLGMESSRLAAIIMDGI